MMELSQNWNSVSHTQLHLDLLCIAFKVSSTKGVVKKCGMRIRITIFLEPT